MNEYQPGGADNEPRDQAPSDTGAFGGGPVPPPRPNWGASPPPPPPPPPGYGYYPPQYGAYAPPPPPRKPGSRFLKFLLVMFFLVGALVVGLIILGVVFRQGGHRRTLALGRDKVGVLHIEGIIGESQDGQFWMDTLKEFDDDDDIKAVVLRIDSPGGAVGDSQEMYGAVERLRNDHKPVFVSMGNVAASGGYYISSAADQIFALKGTLTGSVGVIFDKPELSELAKKIGVNMEVVKSGRFKDAGSPTRPITPEERVMFDALIANTFQQFMTDILKYRNDEIAKAARKLPDDKWAAYQFAMPPERTAPALLKQLADGRAYTGEQALELGLVDKIGTLQDAIEEAGRAAGLGITPSLYEPKRRSTLQEMFQSRLDGFLPKSHASLEYMMQWP